MKVHLYTQGPPENVNALFTQLKRLVPGAFTLHCITSDQRGYAPYIHLTQPDVLAKYTWPEEYYLHHSDTKSFILVIPSNIFLLPSFKEIVTQFNTEVRTGVDGLAFWNREGPTEADYIRFTSFEEWLLSSCTKNYPLTDYYTQLPEWYDRSKDLESVLYDPSFGLYPSLPTRAHVELTDECYLKCPMCVQTNWEDATRPSIFVRGKQLTLSDIERIFCHDFLMESKLTHIELCGNLGEPTQATDFLAICQYLVSRGVYLSILTNGMKTEPEWWARLAEIIKPTYSTVFFGLDGATPDVYERIRVGGNLTRVLDNAKEYIEAGGRAVWKFVKFDQSKAECDMAYQRSVDLGFADFLCVGEYPPEAPTMDSALLQKKWENVLNGTTDARNALILESQTKALVEESPVIYVESLKYRPQSHTYIERKVKTGSPVQCRAKVENRFYLDAGGNVFPCVWTGLELLKSKLSPAHELPFPYDWEQNNAKKVPLLTILQNDFFIRYMGYSLKLDPLAFCRRQCGV